MFTSKLYDNINEWFEIGIKNVPGITFTTGFVVTVVISRRGGKLFTFLIEQCVVSETPTLNIYEYNYSRTVKRRVGVLCSKDGLIKNDVGFKHQDLDKIIGTVGEVLDKHFNHME